jgi:DNA-binding response OmpR family regulator
MSVVVVGELSDERQALVAAAVDRAAKSAVFRDSVALARAELEQRAAHCVVVDVAAPRASELVAWVRGEGALFDLPVIALVDAPTEGSFSEALRLGADDAVARADMNGLTRRAALLDRYVPGALPPPAQGHALLAHPNATRRQLLGRSLRHAGYAVEFAANVQELEQEALKHKPSIAVLAETLDGRAPTALIEKLRAGVGDDALPCVVMIAGTASDGDDERAAALARVRDVMHTPRVAGVLDDQPTDQLLFVVNELMRPEINDVRASPRVLFATLCAFRRAGEFSAAYGMSSNVSREGLFVRTMDAPPADSTLWVELRPPGAAAAVHLTAHVVWVRGLRHGSGGASPPGFGARLLPEACAPAELDRYHAGYQALRDEMRSSA